MRKPTVMVWLGIALWCAGCRSMGGERVIKIAELPKEAAFTTEVRRGGSVSRLHVDIGYVYKRDLVLGIPLNVYGGRWCGYVDDGSTYLAMSKASLDSLAALAHITLPEEPPLPSGDVTGNFIGNFILFPFAIIAIGVSLGSGLLEKIRSRRQPPSPT